MLLSLKSVAVILPSLASEGLKAKSQKPMAKSYFSLFRARFAIISRISCPSRVRFITACCAT
jgi:hypothetical protein